jgi:tRNA dimethylallyltransferase
VTIPVVGIIGPTAAGKSDLALAIARRVRAGTADGPALTGITAAEIVSADSVQLYTGMDIGSAKVTPAERAEVRHHLIDVLTVADDASVAVVQQEAQAAIADCRSRGVLPLVVGGSALYLRAVLDRFELPGTDPGIRVRIEREAEQIGPAALHARLAEIDPTAAAAILPGNVRRVVRALEAIELTGHFTASLPPLEYALGPTMQIGLRLEPDQLAERIERRVDRMWADGLVAEVEHLREAGLAESRTARKALGYAQVLDQLAGTCTEEQARAATVVATRRFARRQLQWWRRDPRIHWLDADADDLPGTALRLIGRFAAEAG